MKIPVFSHDSNPLVDRRLFRKPRHYCESEVAAGRARQLDPADIFQGIQLISTAGYRQQVEHRGSPEARGCLTASESELNADYKGRQSEVLWLAREYEDRLEKHISQGRRGTPLTCSIIAARVKTILSDPALA